jgi:hypothetical protein
LSPTTTTRRGARRASAWATAAALATALAVPTAALGRDCPTTCAGHMWSIGDTLELGAELRAFYFGISVGGTNGARRPGDLPTARPDTDFRDGQPAERAFENNVLLALRPVLFWYPTDGLTIAVENELRFRWPGWEENVFPGTDFAIAGLDARTTSLFLEYEASGVTVTAGLQPFAFGTSAVLDQRFIGLSVAYEHRVFTLAAFGGVTMRHLMRNAGHSMWMTYTSATNGWKFLSNDPSENWAAGLTFSLRNVRPFRLQLLYLFSSPSVTSLQSHVVALHFAGPIVRRFLSFALEPLLFVAPNGPDGDADVLPGVVAELRARLGDHDLAPDLEIGGASSFLHDHGAERRFVSAYENLSWGLIQRFNLEQGHLLFARARWHPSEHVGLFADYTMAFPDGGDSLTDELDVGAWLQVNDLYRLRLAYVGINLASSLEPSHGVYAELRVVIGPQPE